MYETTKNWYDGKEYKRIKSLHRYAYYFRCQSLAGYIKIAVFTPYMIQYGSDYPAFEIFLNVPGDEYITRYFDKDGNEKWSTSTLQNVFQVLDNKENRYGKYESQYWYYEPHCDNKAWINQDGRETLHRELKIKAPAYEAIQKWQESCKEKKRDEADKKTFQHWDEELKLVPKLPKRFIDWAFKENTEHYIFYDAGAKTGWCTRCHKEVTISGQRHRKPGTCPNCKHTIVFMAKGKTSKYLCTPVARSQIIQPIEGGYVIQVLETQRDYSYFDAEKIYKPKLRQDVLYKIICHDGKLIAYSEGWYKQRIYRWLPDTWALHSEHGRLYKKNADAISEMFPHSAAGLIVKNEIDIRFCDYMSKEKEFPVLESLIKIGLYEIVKEILHTSYSWDNTQSLKHLEAAKALELDNNRLKKLISLGGSVNAWEWLKLEKRMNTVFDPEMITFFASFDIWEYNLMFITDRMSYKKIWHYLEKQFNISYESPSQILTTWRDYLQMAEKNKLNTSLEQVYKPADVRKAHAQMIELANKAEIEKEAKPIRRRYKKAEQNMKELAKYEYTADGYSIVAPKSIEDIILEGKILQHCIHRCDYYFERINTKESFIIFLRKARSPKTPWYTLEVEPGGNIRQKRTTGDNQNEDLKAAMPFLRKWQKHIRKIMSKEDKKLADIADKKRKANYKDIRANKKLVWHGKHQGELLADVLEADFMAAI